MHIIRIDLDVDSDNNNGFGAPDRNDAEEQIEDEWQDGFDPLKVVGVNNGDVDQDGIVDWADGYNRDGTAGNQDDGLTGVNFVPIVFELPEPLDPSTARIKLTYDDSSPSGVTVGGGGGLIPADGYLRIWKKNATDARNKSSITSGGDYIPAGTYSASDFGFSTGTRTLTYYMEAIQRSWTWQSRRLLLEVDPNDASTEPGFICSDAVRISAIRILYRQEIDDSTWLWDYDQEKDDAGNVTDLHCPAYIFGKEDDIVVQIDGAPQLLGNSYFKMNVGSSVSYPAGVSLDLHEDTSSPGVYRNTSTYPSYLLRLGPSTVVGTGFKELKVVEEEDLIGKLKKADGTDLGCEGRVMVDRGEYAAGADPGPGDAWKPTTQKFRSEMQKPRVNWHEAGYNDSFTEANLAAFRTFLKNAGSGSAQHGESDLLYYGGHGNDDGNLQMEDSNGDGILSVILNGTGIANGSDWNDDVEWFYTDACLSLHNIAQQGPPERSTGDGYKTWTDALFGTPKPAHMVLGHWDVVDDFFGRSSAIVDDFFDHAAGDPPDTIIDAWFHANSDGWEDQECAIVAHADNITDQLKKVTRDTASTSMKYYWYDPTGIGGTWHDVDYVRGFPKKKKVAVNIPDMNPSVRTVRVREMNSDAAKKGDRYRRVRKYKGSLRTCYIRKDIEKGNVPDSAEKAREVLEDILGNDMIPVDPKKALQGTFYEGSFEWGQTSFTHAPTVIGKVYKWNNSIGGLPVFGDELTLVVLHGRPVKLRRSWHSLEARDAPVKAISPKALEPVLRDAMSKNVPAFDTVTKVSLGYYLFQDAEKVEKTALPVWAFRTENDRSTRTFYFNAITGELLDSRLDIANAMEEVQEQGDQ